MKLCRTVEERRQTLAAAGAIVAEGLRESYSGDPDTLPKACRRPRRSKH